MLLVDFALGIAVALLYLTTNIHLFQLFVKSYGGVLFLREVEKHL